ncbi:bifunctional 4-hydroxy-2-oxoglutarate aldolase/2-dehydro-3-deoxy-phosphogluconate aldolase [Pseudactinotalea sp. Z1739]|uniref:bifunctional 4-hydroxy-2-oxoglutarate aldolase/2-dehydro-3-deoxy-phosphogluconate aldolase n=1 Tax=Pseudactinotalea sp. Z1739 TaxID=3413028 RepID=UPI003C79CF8C
MSTDVGVVAIIRLRRRSPPLEVLEALTAGGITRLEVTLPTPDARATITEWRDRTEAQVGAGTVRSADQAVQAISAGAQFLVTPTIDSGVLGAAAPAGRPVYCGASTPTEIELAHRHPAVAAVKVFPAGPLGGVDYIKAIAEPLDDIPLLPTGGVGAAEATTYAAMGCVGVGVGGHLVNDDLVADQAWAEIRDRAAAMVRAWDDGVERRPR